MPVRELLEIVWVAVFFGISGALGYCFCNCLRNEVALSFSGDKEVLVCRAARVDDVHCYDCCSCCIVMIAGSVFLF